MSKQEIHQKRIEAITKSIKEAKVYKTELFSLKIAAIRSENEEKKEIVNELLEDVKQLIKRLGFAKIALLATAPNIQQLREEVKNIAESAEEIKTDFEQFVENSQEVAEILEGVATIASSAVEAFS